jgi:23S rRNA (uridine2552-2'-O)-methyltransferase
MKKVQDHYFHKAKREGFAARSAYKLEEIDLRKRLLRPGQRVLDLGAAPGSWMQYAAGRVGAAGAVVGVDLQPVAAALPAHARALQGDVYDLAPQTLLQGGPPFDVVLSDLAPKTTGIAGADAARSADIALRALALAAAVLRPGGCLLVKVFQGARMAEVRHAFTLAFERVSSEKPKASRAESVEVFLLGQGLRAAAAPGGTAKPVETAQPVDTAQPVETAQPDGTAEPEGAE